MIYELGLVSVVVGAGYWGWYFVRHRPHGTATFGWMQLAAAALAGLGFLGHRLDIGWLGILGAIGLGAGLCLLLLGPLARMLARRMVAAERMAVATWLLDLAELLAPGSGVAEDKAVVRAMADIREGRIDQTIEALTAARDQVPGADARLAIDERIAMLYLTAYRWRDAIAHAEAHLFGAPATGEDGDGSLRHALGFAVPVWVDLLGAYGRIGDLDRAAGMLARLEDVCAGRADAAPWLHRGRMMFLALAGRPEAVCALTAPRQAGHMSSSARDYWLAVAHERRGNRAAAASIYEQARARSRGRPRALIEQALAGLADTRQVELSPDARAVVDRVEAAPLPPSIRVARRRRVRASWAIAAVLVAVSAITEIAVGDTADAGVLLRSGALVHGVVASGEWWRLISAVFVHVGLIHLGLNVLGLLVLGAIAEDVFGRTRVVAIFGCAGIAGAAASYLASRGLLSAGASGAVFGLLGAVFVEITWRRGRYRLAWKRGLWGLLVVVAVGDLGYGLLAPAIDQWAHGAGLAAGALLGVALSPTARWARAGAVAGRALAIGFVAASAIAAILVVRTTCLDSLTRGGLTRVWLGELAIRVPARWPRPTREPVPDGQARSPDPPAYQVEEPDGLVVLELALRSGDAGRQIALWIAEQGRGVKDTVGGDEAGAEHGELIESGSSPLIALPAGWDGRELVVVSPDDGMGNRQRYRLIACGRVSGDRTMLVAILVPETIAAAAPGFFAQLLASIEA
ncbi:MAG TPA: rhomboid family intramembrane serine protease [Kofleriaceae bacterium]|nr:rhomboid family intramembrane serine protease [Kofleriaceae bacterium]